jgi:HEAT repeat protein
MAVISGNGVYRAHRSLRMARHFRIAACVLLSCAVSPLMASQASTDIESPTHKAWDILQMAAMSKSTTERSNGVRALGLLRENKRARQMAEDALQDHDPTVRAAAATALGQMHARESIPKLMDALSDHKIHVVMAAAQSLRELKDDKPAYAIYYDLLVGERKTGDGLIQEQLDTLKNPRELAKIGFSEGIGYVPFAGIGWDAYRTMKKKDPNPVRAVAATLLAHDPDPSSAKALVAATNDKDWIVRAAALEAIALRGDPSLLPQVEEKFRDRHPKVRYSAAAAVIRLSAIEQKITAKNSR